MSVIIDYGFCLIYAAVFLGVMRLEKPLKGLIPKPKVQASANPSFEETQLTKEATFCRDQRKMQLRIALVLFACILLSWHNYSRKCADETITQCFHFPLDKSAVVSTIKALLLNFTLFVGPLYQDYKSSKIRIKFKDFDFKRFRWNEFKRIVMVIKQQMVKYLKALSKWLMLCLLKGPVLEEWVFRNLINNLINKNFENNWTFICFSATMYSLVHLHNYKRFKKRLEPQNAKLAIGVQMVISFLFGGHMAYLFTKIRYIGAGFIMHAYCKFMGIPNIIALLRMDTQQDLIAKKIMMYYAGGIAGYLIECILLIE